MTIRCFLLEETGRTVRKLRRYSPLDAGAPRACPGFGYHNAMTPLDVLEGVGHLSGDLFAHDDPRWPATCEACDYRFTLADAWQVFSEREMRRTDTGELTTIRDAPVGAMWFADWLKDAGAGLEHRTIRAGQPHLIVKTPAGDWDVDGISSNGPGWTRTGTPPALTVRPSIGIGDPMRYHAFLTNGELVDC